MAFRSAGIVKGVRRSGAGGAGADAADQRTGMDPAEQAARRAYNEQVEAIHQAGAEEAVLRGTYIRGKDCDSLDAFGADPKERKVTACECCGQVGAKKKCGQCRCVY